MNGCEDAFDYLTMLKGVDQWLGWGLITRLFRVHLWCRWNMGWEFWGATKIITSMSRESVWKFCPLNNLYLLVISPPDPPPWLVHVQVPSIALPLTSLPQKRPGTVPNEISLGGGEEKGAIKQESNYYCNHKNVFSAMPSGPLCCGGEETIKRGCWSWLSTSWPT